MGLFDKLFGRKDKAEEKPAPTSCTEPESDDADYCQGGGSVPQELAHMEALEMYNSDDPPVFLDCREPHEIQANGAIPNAIQIPTGEIESRYTELNPDTPVIVYCATGMRSFDVGCLLLENGFKDVSNLNGGFNAWKGPKTDPQNP